MAIDRPHQKTYAQPSVRTYMIWSVDRLRAAERAADGGDFRLAGEFVDALMGDDRFGALLRTRAQALLGSKVTFEASGDGRRKGKAVRALETEEDWWAIAPTTRLAEIHQWGLMLFAPVENVWRQRHGRDIPTVRFWHPSLTKRNIETGQWSVKTRDGWIDIQPGDGKWSIYSPFGPDRPWVYALWRGLARWWLLKQYAIDDWGKHSENASMRVASRVSQEHDDQASTKKARQELAQDLYDCAKDGSIVLPDGFKLELVEATANTRDIYDAQITTANTSGAVSILGHNLTSEVGGAGSYAASKTGDVVRADLRNFDDDVMSCWSHDDVLAFYALYNFGSADNAAWVTWAVAPPKDRKLEAETFTMLSRGLPAFERAGADIRALLERFDIPMLSPEAAAAQRAAAPPATAAPVPADDKES
jgi:hypothetical protein